MIEQIKQLRLETDETVNLLKTLTDKPSVHINRCISAALLGKAWLGKLMGEYGEATPYQNDGKRHTVKDIEAAVDIKKSMPWDAKTNHIERVDQCRQRIAKVTEDIKNLQLARGTWGAAVARTNAYSHLSEAFFNLGFELRGIREASITKK